MASGCFNNQRCGQGSNNWVADDVRVALVAPTYTFNPDVEFLGQLASELSGTGYVRKQLTNKSVVRDDTANQGEYMADPVTWSGANFGTVKGAIIYLHNASDAAARLIAYCELSAQVTTTGTAFTLNWGSEGVFKAA